MTIPTLASSLSTLTDTVRRLLNSTQPVRVVVRRHGRSYRGFWPSRKGISPTIPYESNLALCLLRLCEFHPDVLKIIPEPGPMSIEFNGKLSRYTPDYVLRMRDGSSVVVEVKYSKEATEEENQLRFYVIGGLLARENSNLLIATEETLKNSVLQENLALLEAHRRVELTQRTREIITRWLDRTDVPFPVLVARVGDRHQVIAAIAQEIVSFDFQAPIDSARLWRV